MIWIVGCLPVTTRSLGMISFSDTCCLSCPCLTPFLFLFYVRPFARRLPEFKFWHSCTRSVLIAICMTFFSIFDVPVFWPILLLYFIVLFFITMKRQINHMIKHRYVPFSFGKTTYNGGGKAPVKDSK